MAKAKVAVLVDWNNDGDYDHAQSDITDDVIELSWSRGRDYASQLSGNSISGKLSATLYNNGGKYSPSNTSSPITGKIEPAIRIQVRAGTGSFPYTFPVVFNETKHFVGRLEEIRPEPSAVGNKRAKLTAYGSLGFLNNYKVSLATQLTKRTDEAITAILDDAGWSATERTLATGQTTFTRFWVDSTKTIDALRIPEETEGGFVKESKEGKIVFESRHTRLAGDYITSQATFSDASGASVSFKRISQTDPLATIVNHAQAKTKSYTTAGSATVLWTLGEIGTDSPVLAPNEVRTFEAEYPNPESDNDAVEVNAWTTPASTTDYLGNTASDGSGTNMTSSLSVANEKIAQRMIITITNTSTSTSVYLTKLQARGTAVTQKTTTVRQKDTTSITKYGERKFVAETEFIPNSTEAQRWCEFQLSIYATPVNIIQMSFSANGSESYLYQSLARDISDRITVTATGNSELGINGDFFIESERHRITASDHRVTWNLSPATGGYSSFWLLGTGKLNDSTVPAY